MKRPGRFAVFALGGLVVQGLLASGALSVLPVEWRIVLAFATLVMLPGYGWFAAIGASPPGGAWLASGWALGFGVAWLGVQVLVTRALHVPFTLLATASLLPNLLPWVVAYRTAPAAPRAAAAGERLRGPALVAVLVAALVAGVHVARVPTPVSYYTDSPDHIGTIRRMMAEGDAFPTDAFFRDAGRAGSDPRKGLWHPEVATIATLARADALDAWRVLAALLAPLFALNAAAFAWLLGGGAAAAVGAWALVLTYGSSLAAPYLREAVFATKLADQLALATATAMLADLDVRDRRSRVGVIALGLGALSAHVFASLQFAVVFGALGVGLLVQERGFGARARRLAVTASLLGLACLPYLLFRAKGAYAPANVIHTEPQGLLTLLDGVQVVSFGVLWDWLGRLWLLAPLSLVAWGRNASRPAVLYLLTTTLAVGTLLFFPPVVSLLQPRLGYLLMRFIWLVPLAGIVAFAVVSLVRGVAHGGGARRALSVLGLAGVAALAAPVLGDAARVLTHPRAAREADEAESTLRWRDELAWMDRGLPAGTVVLSDPATSYSIPMMTRHWVTTLVDQHSSPNDSLALDRILDSRDALDPGQPYARTRDVVRRWGATAIVLNDRFAEAPKLDYWAPQHTWFRAARARLDAAPQAFPRIHDSGDFVVYGIDAAVLDTLSGGAQPRPYVRPFDPARDTTARPGGRNGADVLSLRLSARSAQPGDTLSAVIAWHVPRRLPAGSYHVAVRFEGRLPADFSAPAWCAKPARKVLEGLRRHRWRFRDEHLPVGGDYGVDLWRPDQVVSDSFTVVVPGDVAPGPYRVEVVMLRQPHYPILRLSDYFFDRDYFSGVEVGRLDVRPASGR